MGFEPTNIRDTERFEHMNTLDFEVFDTRDNEGFEASTTLDNQGYEPRDLKKVSNPLAHGIMRYLNLLLWNHKGFKPTQKTYQHTE